MRTPAQAAGGTSEFAKRVAGIDGMRGVAAVGIVIHHLISTIFHVPSGFFRVSPPWAPNGYLFVDLFFVLSGFLVTTVSMRSFRPNLKRVTDFYRKRAERLLPALVVFAAVHAAYAIATGAGKRRVLKNLIVTLTFTLNLPELVPFDVDFIDGLQPLWSLAVEWHFYLLVPIVMVAVTPLKCRSQVLVVSGLAVAVVVWRTQQFHAGTSPLYLYTRTDFRLDALLIGMALALAWPKVSKLSRPVLTTLGWVGLVGFAAHVANTSTGDAYRFTFGGPVVALCAAGLTAAAATGVGPSTLWSGKAIQAVGRASYSLYIWHMLVITAVVRTAPDVPRPAQVAASAVLIAVVTATSWHLVEKPAASYFRKRRSTRDDRPDSVTEPTNPDRGSLVGG